MDLPVEAKLEELDSTLSSLKQRAIMKENNKTLKVPYFYSIAKFEYYLIPVLRILLFPLRLCDD